MAKGWQENAGLLALRLAVLQGPGQPAALRRKVSL